MNPSKCDLYPHEKSIAINNLIVKFKYNSLNAQDMLFRPFSHLAHTTSPGENVALVIYARLGNGSERALKLWTQMKDQASDGKVLIQKRTERIHCLYNADSGVITSLNLISRIGFYYAPDIRTLPYYEKAAPMRLLMHYLAELNDMILVHGASVAIGGRAVILAGKGGSGKTTTAIAAALSGLEYLGDDYVMIDYRKKTVHSLICSAKIRWAAHHIIPSVKEYSINSQEDDKSYFFMNELTGLKLIGSAQIAAIIVPEIIPGREPNLTGIPSIKALLLLASSTIFQMPGSGQHTLSRLKTLMQSLPAYKLVLSPSSALNNALIVDLINGDS